MINRYSYAGCSQASMGTDPYWDNLSDAERERIIKADLAEELKQKRADGDHYVPYEDSVDTWAASSAP